MPRPQRGKGPRQIACLGSIKPGGQHKRHIGARLNDKLVQVSRLIRVEWVAAGGINQDWLAGAAMGQRLGQHGLGRCHRQCDTQNPREGRQLLHRARALAIRGDHQRRRSGQHHPGCQLGGGEGLAGARWSTEQ